MNDDIFQHTDRDGDQVAIYCISEGFVHLDASSRSGSSQVMVFLKVEDIRALRDALTAWLDDGPKEREEHQWCGRSHDHPGHLYGVDDEELKCLGSYGGLYGATPPVDPGPPQTTPDQWAQVAEDIRAMRRKLEEGVAALTRADVLKKLADEGKAERTAAEWDESAADARYAWTRWCGSTYDGRRCTRVAGHVGTHNWDGSE